MKLIVFCAVTATLAYGQTSAAIRVTGVVRAFSGEILQGEVSAFNASNGLQVTVARIAENGTYDINLPAGNLTLTARADGFVSEQRDIAVRSNDRNLHVDFMLTPAGSVEGHVVDGSGSPVPGARVWLTYPGERAAWRRAEEAGGEEADAFGAFRIPVVARNRPFVLHAENDSWLMSSSGVLKLTDGDLQGIILVLSRRGTTITGRVVDPTGRPAAGATVHLRIRPDDSEYSDEQRQTHAFARNVQKFATTNADGGFAFTGVPGGSIFISAELAGARASTDLTSASGRESAILLTLR